MKKTYSAKRNALLTVTSLSWGARALSVVLLLVLVRFSAPDFFWQVTAPLFRVSDSLTGATHTFFSSFADTATLVAESEELAHENAALVIENQALSQKVENLSLLLDPDTDTRESPPGILAAVVARPPVSPYDVLVVAQGSRTGVSYGMEAFGAGGAPLGIVESTTENFSRVVLFSAPGMRTEGWVGSSNIPITINGAGGGVIVASLARAAAVAVGDVVFVPGPGMLPVGTVARIDSDPSSPSVSVRITPLINLFSTTWVHLRTTGIALPGVSEMVESAKLP